MQALYLATLTFHVTLGATASQYSTSGLEKILGNYLFAVPNALNQTCHQYSGLDTQRVDCQVKSQDEQSKKLDLMNCHCINVYEDHGTMPIEQLQTKGTAKFILDQGQDCLKGFLGDLRYYSFGAECSFKSNKMIPYKIDCACQAMDKKPMKCRKDLSGNYCNFLRKCYFRKNYRSGRRHFDECAASCSDLVRNYEAGKCDPKPFRHFKDENGKICNRSKKICVDLASLN